MCLAKTKKNNVFENQIDCSCTLLEVCVEEAVESEPEELAI